jgi:hypothetical protein
LPESIEPYHDTLTRGQALVFYTDGLIERRNESLDQGLQRLARSVVLPATSGDLCDAALSGCLTGVRRNDDVCILAIRYDDN